MTMYSIEQICTEFNEAYRKRFPHYKLLVTYQYEISYFNGKKIILLGHYMGKAAAEAKLAAVCRNQPAAWFSEISPRVMILNAKSEESANKLEPVSIWNGLRGGKAYCQHGYKRIIRQFNRFVSSKGLFLATGNFIEQPIKIVKEVNQLHEFTYSDKTILKLNNMSAGLHRDLASTPIIKYAQIFELIA